MSRLPCGSCRHRNTANTLCGPCITSPLFPSYDGPRIEQEPQQEQVLQNPALFATDVERYPDDNPKTRFGLAKPPIALIPGPALVIAAEAMRDGASKYGPANWREKPVTTSTYTSAAMRHLLAWIDGEENAPDSGVHHLGHVMGCIAILIDAQAQGTLNDDRPTPGKTAELLAEKTRPMA